MKRLFLIILVTTLAVGAAAAQSQKPQPKPATTAEPGHSNKTSEDDVQQLNADLQRLKVLLNQMRTNLAFVQTSQSPLKHQFELETDAWQVLIDQMERRLRRMNERSASGSMR